MSCTGSRENLRFIRGTSKTYRVTVVDDDGERVDLTGATAHFRVKLTIDDVSAVITKISTTPAQITILTQSGTTLGQYDVFIVPGDTSMLAPATYVYDSFVVLASGKRYCVLEPAEFVIERAVTEL